MDPRASLALTEFDYLHARANVGAVRILLADYDPYHWNTRAAGANWRYVMGAEVSFHQGAFDFTATPQPEVLTAVKEMLRRLRSTPAAIPNEGV